MSKLCCFEVNQYDAIKWIWASVNGANRQMSFQVLVLFLSRFGIMGGNNTLRDIYLDQIETNGGCFGFSQLCCVLEAMGEWEFLVTIFI